MDPCQGSKKVRIEALIKRELAELVLQNYNVR